MKAEHVAQHQRGPLPRRQDLQRRHERERDRLAASRSAHPGRAPCRQGPRSGRRGRARSQLGSALRVGSGGSAIEDTSCGRRLRARSTFETVVGRDPVQPGAQRGPPLEALEPAPGRDQRLLQLVLGVLQRAEDPVAVQPQLGPVGLGSSRNARSSPARARLSAGSLITCSSPSPVQTPRDPKTHRSRRKSRRVAANGWFRGGNGMATIAPEGVAAATLVDADEARATALRTARAHDVERRRALAARALRPLRPRRFDVLAVTDHTIRDERGASPARTSAPTSSRSRPRLCARARSTTCS